MVANTSSRTDNPDRRGVLLMNLGTPDAPDTASVRRYLSEFLADPEVIKLPRGFGWMNGLLGRFIGLMRGAHSARAYRAIWTDRGSPLKVITEDQVVALESTLAGGWQVFYAMRYGNPSVDAALKQIIEQGITELVVIPMYPQYSGPTTGTALGDLYRSLERCGRHLEVRVRNAWFDDAGYIDAQARLIQESVERANLTPDNCRLVFSAHSMPKSYVEAGDPYQQHVLRTVDLVMERLGWPADRMMVSYQSKLGPVPWLEPSTADTLQRLSAAGEPNILVCPLSFTADCLESLEEIGIAGRRDFEAAGGRLHLVPALNTFEPFIKALSRIVLKGPRPAGGRRTAGHTPLLSFKSKAEAPPSDFGSLVMLGTSIIPRLEGGRGPNLKHATPEQYQRIKMPHEEVAGMLRELREVEGVQECWLWNTCSRFELYGWLNVDPTSSEADQLLARINDRVIGRECNDVPVNLLRGPDAWHHLLRTAAGLNSGLPGDGEILGQMVVAHRVAERCETAGPLTEQLLTEVTTDLDKLRRQTTWGMFRPEYCSVAIRRIFAREEMDWANTRCLVIGGSATARSILTTLREQCDVPEQCLTAVHRAQSRGAQLKRIRKAVGKGTRLRVDTYRDQRVLDAIADADIVFYAIDRRDPIHDAADLRHLRDFVERPMTVIDFNTFASTSNLDTVDGVRRFEAAELEAEVSGYADGLCECPAFNVAREEAEVWLSNHLPTGCPCDRSGAKPEEASEDCPVRSGPKCHGCARQADCPNRLLAERIGS